eukprot:gnl/Chilomastix_cuspidata/1415.p3 GENE.gnl/Chilomastix_cuspidata/1415~~gnl/Chilomastix_cuspidata/1415.p3  ORF type:complete len:404 (-),score=100.22 gnl/Chilomastix_cuspidata/1415:308-1519(-)
MAEKEKGRLISRTYEPWEPEWTEFGDRPDPRYLLGKAIGEGGFSRVYPAFDQRTKKNVILKIIKSEVEGASSIASSIVHEINIMQEISHEYIVPLEDVFFVGNDIAIILPRFLGDLWQIVSRESGILLTDAHIRAYSRMIISSVAYLHRHRILHRDIKSSNFLVAADGSLRLTDFGTAIPLRPSQRNLGQVGTKTYMAPEVLFGARDYGFPADAWSVGVLIAEMFLRRNLFGADPTSDDLAAVVGQPSDTAWKKMSTLRLATPISRTNPSCLLDADLSAQKIGPDAHNLLAALLRWDPLERATMDTALSMPFLDGPTPLSLPLPPGVDLELLGIKAKPLDDKEESMLARKHALFGVGSKLSARPPPGMPADAIGDPELPSAMLPVWWEDREEPLPAAVGKSGE